MEKTLDKIFNFTCILLLTVILTNNCFADNKVIENKNVLEKISYTSIPGNKIQIVLGFKEDPPKANVFTVDKPARISIDLANTRLNAINKRQKVNIGTLRNINAVTTEQRTRVILTLTSHTGHEIKVDEKNIIIIINKKPNSRQIVSPNQTFFKNIDFRLGDNNEGNIILTFSKNPGKVRLKEMSDKIIAEIENIELPSELKRRLDVRDFNTPVSYIDTATHENNLKVIVDTKGEHDYIGYQTDNVFTIEVKGLTKEEKRERLRNQLGYSGEKLSLNFQDIELRAVLQLIAEFTGKNLITSDSVKGNITLRLKNIPWDQALDLILKTKGLGLREEGNVMRIAPAEELSAIETQELEANKKIADLLPLVSETIQLQYVPASQVVSLLEKMSKTEASNNQVSDNPEDNEASYMSSRATIVGDDRTNKIIVRDTSRNISQLRLLIDEIDTPTKQVLIDARIVSATDNFKRDLGLSWNFRSTKDGVYRNPGDPRTGGIGDVASQATRANMDLGKTAKNILGMTFGILDSSYLIDLEIQASQVEDDIEVISSPRIVTTNGSQASIKSGTQIPYQTAEDGTVTTQFIDAVLSLDVTPLIIPGNKVNMAIKINKDSPGGSYNGETGIDTKEIVTNVLVDNGETVVLGGIYERINTNQVDSVPILGDIPVVGNAFKVKNKSDNRSELIVFITPKIMLDGVSFK